jgi:hypothetical protein
MRRWSLLRALRVPAAGVAALVVLLAALGGAPVPRANPTGVPVAHVSVVLRPRYDPPDRGLERPDPARLTLTLLADGSGILAQPGRYGEVVAAGVGWRRDGNRFELAPGGLGYMKVGNLSWEAWTLTLADTDADGVLDTGAGRASGTFQIMLGDVIDFARYEAELEATPDTTDPVASLSFPRDPMPLPVDARVRITFSEPVRWNPDGPRLMANDALVPSRISPTGLLHGYVTGALLELDELVPFGAALALDPGAIADGGGRAASWNGDTLRTPPDPGPFAADVDFPADLSGWLVDGRAGAFPDSAPDRVRVQSGGRLTGYLDVPADAQALEIEAEFFSEIGRYDGGLSGVIDLIVADARTRVFDVSGVQEGGPCTCPPNGHTTGPLHVRADLVPFRGKRVLVTFASRASGYLGMNEYAIDVRRVRLVR